MMTLHVAFLQEYLHLTLAQSKRRGQGRAHLTLAQSKRRGQGRAHLRCENLANDDRWKKNCDCQQTESHMQHFH